MTAINSGKNVIIDATNLNPKTTFKRNSIAKELNVDVEFKQFNVSFDEAFKRDSERGDKSVGRRVLKRFYKLYSTEEIKESFIDEWLKISFYKTFTIKTSATIVNLDGTICLHNGRDPYDLTNVSNDIPNTPLINLLIDLNIKHHITFLSGRENKERCFEDSEKWLKTFLW